MRTIRIRTFTVITLSVMLMLPWVFFVTAHFIQTHTLTIRDNQWNDQEHRKQVADTIRFIEAGSKQWANAGWQQELHIRLQQANMDAVLLDAENRENYRSHPGRLSNLRMSAEQFTILDAGQVVGRATVYVPNTHGASMIAAFAGLLLAFVIAGLALRRYILKPLAKMGLTARQIADGDWDVQLPPSSITEIAEVREGFNVMVNGLRQLYRKQAELEEERRFVIAAVAHDLRTPLFALRGYLDGIEQGIARSPEKLERYLAVCKEKSAQLDRLVEDLFIFTKMEYLEAEIRKDETAFSQVLLKAADSLRPSAERKHIAVAMHIAHGDLTVAGDSHLLERAMTNVLDNAIRHTPPYGRIVVECNQEHHKVTFAVRDTGPGFASEDLGRVFEPLYRGEESRNRATGGAGLGLTISRRIIRRHGGELAAGNDPRGGALLSGWLPAADDGSYDRSQA